MTSATAIVWLKFDALFVIGFGAMMAAAALPVLAAPTTLLLDLAFFPLDGAQSMDAPAIRLFSAICGGVLVGWGALLWLVADRLAPRDPGLARLMILLSLVSWFVVDSIGSAVSGGHGNVLGNTVFLLMFLIPALHLPRAADALAERNDQASFR